MAKRFLAVQTLVKYHAHRPHVDFRGNFRRHLADHKALWRQVPIGTRALARQVHALLWVVTFLVHDFGQAEVCYLNITADNRVSGEKYVAWLQVVVDDRRLNLV